MIRGFTKRFCLPIGPIFLVLCSVFINPTPADCPLHMISTFVSFYIYMAPYICSANFYFICVSLIFALQSVLQLIMKLECPIQDLVSSCLLEGDLVHLREICLSFNQLTDLPSCLSRCGKLETILAANNKVVLD